MLERGATIEHDTSPTSRWLRERRLRFALWTAVIEGVLVAVGFIPWQVAVILAVGIIVLYFWAAHRLRGDAARQIAWIAAVSQAVVALIPVVVIVVGAFALIAVAAIAVVALIVLLSDRR